MPTQDDDLRKAQERLTVLLAQQGDREAFARLIDWYDRRLLYFVRRMLGESDGAFDVLQSAWLTVHRKLGRLKSPDAFRVWLYRIVHDQAVSELRKRSKWPRSHEGWEAVPTASEPGADEAAFENAELVHQALQSLSVDHRRVLTLRFLEEMTMEEIAAVIDCSAGTVKSRLHYAKLALRRRIEELSNE